MQNIPFHIAYLLSRHECVIVPGLGAFVVSSSNKEKARRKKILSPPGNFLGFNSEIKHNDGLLANSIAKEMKCSYRDATLLIEQYVNDIQQNLNKGERVYIPQAGSLYLKDNKKLFQSEREDLLSCNASNYGLTDFSLPYIKDIQKDAGVSPEKGKNKEIIWIPIDRKFVTYAGSIVAAIVAICIIPTPLNNEHFDSTRTQYAALINLPTQNARDANDIKNVPDTTVQIPQNPSSAEIKIPHPAEITNPAETIKFHYYIIIASFPDQRSAEKTLAEIQSGSFENAAILSSDGRHRIYTNRFEDKAEAEKFLIQFRKDYPEQANAWLLKL